VWDGSTLSGRARGRGDAYLHSVRLPTRCVVRASLLSACGSLLSSGESCSLLLVSKYGDVHYSLFPSMEMFVASAASAVRVSILSAVSGLLPKYITYSFLWRPSLLAHMVSVEPPLSCSEAPRSLIITVSEAIFL